MTQEQLETKLFKNNINYVMKLDFDGEYFPSSNELNKGSLFIINSGKSLELEEKFINMGAKGVFWIPEDLNLIDDVIATLNKGGFWFDRLTMSNKIMNQAGPTADVSISNHILISRLTKREVEIAKLVVTGLSNREIAKNKCISETTVKSHLKNILAKADVKNRTALVNKLSF